VTAYLCTRSFHDFLVFVYSCSGSRALAGILKWFEQNDIVHVNDLVGVDDLTEWPGAPDQKVDDVLLADSIVQVTTDSVFLLPSPCLLPNLSARTYRRRKAWHRSPRPFHRLMHFLS
jgi:hypothetical protein